MLEKLILKEGPESSVPVVMAFDMMVAGIDTTGNTAAFLLYNLSVNPEAQERLREELCAVAPPHEPVTPAKLSKLRYYQACLRESFRMHPTVPVRRAL